MSLRRNRGLIRQGPPGLLYPGGSLISPRSGNRLWRYTACEISVADPGAVPGASTSFAPAGPAIRGGELGSTRVVKVRSVARYDSVVIGSESSCERQLRTRGARGLTPSGVKALSKSRFEGHRATEAPHSPRNTSCYNERADGMAQDLFDYPRMVQTALRNVMREALARIASEGLPGDHHFYVTFRTRAPGAIVPKSLLTKYPDE